MRKKLVKNLLSMLFSKGLMLLFTILNSILLARILGPEGKGLVTAILIYPMMLISLFEMGIRQSVVFYINSNKYSNDKIIGTVIVLMIIMSILGALLLCFIFIKNGLDYPLFTIIIAILLLPLNIIKSYTSGIVLGFQRIDLYSRILFIPPLINLIVSVIFVWYLNFGVNGGILGVFLGALFVSIYAIIKTFNTVKISFTFSIEIAKDLFILGVKYALSLFVLNLNYKIDIILLEKLSTVSEIGFYSLCVQFSELIWQLPAAIGIVVFSMSAANKNTREYTFLVLKLFRIVMIFSIFLALMLFLTVDIFIPMLYGVEYTPSINMFKILLPGIVFAIIFKVMNFDLAGKGKPLVALYAAFPSLVVNIVLNIILIPRFSGYGAAISSSISYSVMAILYLIFYVKQGDILLRDVFRFSYSDFKILNPKGDSSE